MSTPSPNNGQGYSGYQQTNSASNDRNSQTFFVWSILSRVRTIMTVQVMGVTNDGGISPVGFVDIMPLVNQIDGSGNAVPHEIIYQCPYSRLQGGGNAIILDPQVGDIGIAGFADRDISSVTANKGQANPGSRRMFDMADGIYIGGMLNGTPTQYVQFNSGGINIVSPGNIDLQATGNINLQAGGNIGLAAGAALSTNSTGNTTMGAAALIINAPVTFNNSINCTTTGAGQFVFASPITAPDVILPNGSINNHIHYVPAAPGNSNVMTE